MMQYPQSILKTPIAGLQKCVLKMKQGVAGVQKSVLKMKRGWRGCNEPRKLDKKLSGFYYEKKTQCKRA